MNYLKSLGENHGFPVSAAFVLLLTEYIQANPDMLRYAIDDVKKRKNSSTQRAVGLSEPQIDKQEQTKEGG